MSHHTPEQPADIVARLRATFRTGRTRPVEWRTGQLRRMRAMLTERGADLAAALKADLGKSSTEAYRTEIDFTVREIDQERYALKALRGDFDAAERGLGAVLRAVGLRR